MTATRKPTNKIRLNLAVSPAAMRIGKRLAKVENRSFSNLLEVLIQRAGDDRKQAEKAKLAA